jgi:rfaE bifunctional protein kinase chain/domain
MSSFLEYLIEFKNKRILVLGDVMLDSYIRGDVHRVSPEAPVPIVSFKNREERLGGAANVALNLVALGALPFLCSIVGNDDEADRFLNEASKNNIDTLGVLRSARRQTTVKTRIIGNNQQLLRVDKEQTDDIDSDLEIQLLDRIQKLVEKQHFDALIFEDYNKGVLTPKIIQQVIELCRIHNIPTAVDPKKDNFLEYRNVTLFKPNFKELKEGLGLDFSFEKGATFENAVTQLQKQLNAKLIFVTLSEYGVYIQSEDKGAYIDAHRRAIRDVSGAGDTVIAVATMGLVAGMGAFEIAELANIAGGLVCEKSGVVSIALDELKSELVRLAL